MREECSMSKSKERRPRRSSTPEFRAEVLELCRTGGQTVAEVCQRLGLHENTVRLWLRQAKVAAAPVGAPETLSTSEREELVRLRRENRRLLEERTILKKAAVFFAKENS
jgi:transposase